MRVCSPKISRARLGDLLPGLRYKPIVMSLMQSGTDAIGAYGLT